MWEGARNYSVSSCRGERKIKREREKRKEEREKERKRDREKIDRIDRRGHTKNNFGEELVEKDLHCRMSKPSQNLFHLYNRKYLVAVREIKR